jgi:spermidine/putrescine-binding protein
MRKTVRYTWTDYKADSKRTEYSPSFEQNAGIQKKMVAATHKQNAP